MSCFRGLLAAAYLAWLLYHKLRTATIICMFRFRLRARRHRRYNGNNAVIVFSGVDLRMNKMIWLVQLLGIGVLASWGSASFALTPEEILKLKAAGVSEETIQLLLQKEQEEQIPASTVEQGYATDHMGAWKLKDGRTITSTGKRRLPLHYPTDYPPPSPYMPYMYPYVTAPSVQDWRSTAPPVSHAERREPIPPPPASTDAPPY